MLTSATMRLYPEQYIDFLYDPDDDILKPLEDFCLQDVEPMGKEAGEISALAFKHVTDLHAEDHVQITALSHALQINFEIAYLDGHGHTTSGPDVSFVKIPDSAHFEGEPVRLLYRYVCRHLIVVLC